jgi:hypothetical protein
MLRSLSIRQLARIALLPAFMILPVACSIDDRTGRVIDGDQTGDAGSSASPSGSNTGAGGGAGASSEGDGVSELSAGAQLSGSSRTGSGGTGGASQGVDSPDDDGSSGAGGSVAAEPSAMGSSGAGSSGAGANAAGATGSAGSAGSAGTANEPPDTSGSTGVGPAPVFLGEAGTFAILAQSAITNVPFSAITGDLGISPAAASSITGFPLVRAGTSLLAPEVVGKVFAADSDPPTPDNLISAISDMQAAYDDAAGRITPEFSELGAGSIGGLTLAPGLYKWTSLVSIPADVTISGASNDTWIFQIAGDLTFASGTRVILSGGAQAKNIVWQVAGAVTLATTSHAEGIVLSKTAIHLQAGASIDGQLLAQTAVTLAMATVSAP